MVEGNKLERKLKGRGKEEENNVIFKLIVRKRYQQQPIAIHRDYSTNSHIK
jgi:hypothetical protein